MHTKRYTFKRVFWVVAALYLFFALLGFVVLWITPGSEKNFNFHKYISPLFIAGQLFSLAFTSCFYYFSLNTYHDLITRRRPILDYIKPTVIAFFFLAVYYAVNHFFLNEKQMEVAFNNSKIKPELPVALMIFSYLLSSFFFIGISLVVAYFTSLQDDKKQRKILEEQKLQLEIEKSQANLNFLKAQINPHFLHNTLNFLYAKSLPYSEELSEGILTLSDIMRYALSEGNTKDGKAPLKDEIEHVRNVIRINQLRFSNKLNVQFEVTGVVNGAMIIPFVLITLVENAFKHGDLKSTDHPIVISLGINGNRLVFSCRNKKKTGPKEISTGVGLDNIKKRLELAYRDNYSLKVTEDSDFYTTELRIAAL